MKLTVSCDVFLLVVFVALMLQNMRLRVTTIKKEVFFRYGAEMILGLIISQVVIWKIKFYSGEDLLIRKIAK